jgi:hypothetical protein
MKLCFIIPFVAAFSLLGCNAEQYCKWHIKADYTACQGDQECIAHEQMKTNHTINRCMENWTNYTISADRVYGEDGALWFVIQCQNHDRCLEDVGDICPYGYIVGDRNNMTQGKSFYYKGSGGSKLATTETIMFQCKVKSEPLPPNSSLGY